MGIASTIFFVTVTEGVIRKNTTEKLISGFAVTILDYRKQLKMRKRWLLVAPTYSEKVTKALLLTPSGSAVVVKRSAWGVILPPPP